MINLLQCPVCRSEDFSQLLQAKDYTVSGQMFGICHCLKCQHRFTNPIPPQHEIGEYYKSQDYVSHTNTSKGIINRLYQMVRRFTLKRKRKLLQRASGKEKGKLLDVGSGAGAFLSTMQLAGWECLGLEPDPDARKVAKADFQVETESSEKLFELPDGTFDCITLWHVLEHVHQLDAYMKKLHALLKTDGRLFIAVPNYKSKDAAHYHSAWAAYDVPRHLYHFCPQSMQQLLGRHGLKLVEMKRMPFDSFYVSMLTARNLGKSIIGGIWIGWLSWWVALFNKKRCSSLIYIIQK